MIESDTDETTQSVEPQADEPATDRAAQTLQSQANVENRDEEVHSNSPNDGKINDSGAPKDVHTDVVEAGTMVGETSTAAKFAGGGKQ